MYKHTSTALRDKITHTGVEREREREEITQVVVYTANESLSGCLVLYTQSVE